MNEIFKDIEGYEGLYQVSNTGKVKSLNNKSRKERILKPSKNRYGYLMVVLYKYCKFKGFRVNRLVADAFIPNPENEPEVGHKDDVKTNNMVSNLYWTDHKSNCNYGTRNEKISKKLSKVMINNEKLSKKVLCVETNTVYPSAMEAERQTGIYQTNIVKCCNGKRKTAGKFHWQYIDFS